MNLLANQLQNGHVLIGPFDPALPCLGKGKVLYVAGYLRRCLH